ncbi:MAG: NAD(P)H-dependent glycerol-3-phosphate dehydrogenase, partial [Magnetococcales bacterium]|nr:NAD(P)H-dependent glycerol-3-phosphate dehydrogenase [Magnetococcales bacterium]
LVVRVQQLFHTTYFRTYSTDDVVGLELGGALKNIIALAAGISDGLGLGHSARAALITRGLSEMMRLGAHMGAKGETFFGLSGMGDLLLTATSDLSRNRTVGFRLGAGETLAQIQQGSREVAEGVKTTQGVFALARKLGIEMPITRAVHDILYAGLSPLAAVKALMERELKPESPAAGE